MGWHKFTRKITKSVKKFGDNFLPGFRQLHKNWNDIRTPLMYAGAAIAAAYTGGAALGALGIGAGGLAGTAGAAAGASAATGAAIAGGTSAALTGAQVRAGEKAADRAAAEQERIAAEEAEQNRRLSLLKAGQTPEGVSELSLEAKRRMRSQYQRNQVSRQNNKTLGGSSSTLA